MRSPLEPASLRPTVFPPALFGLLLHQILCASSQFLGRDVFSVGGDRPLSLSARLPGRNPAHLLRHQLRRADACSAPSVQHEVEVLDISVEGLQNGFCLWLNYRLGRVCPCKLMN